MTIVAIAGATGDLGGRIAAALRREGAEVRALVRPGADPATIGRLKALGCAVVRVDLARVPDLARAVAGADIVVSALSGVGDVIVGAQGRLLGASVAAGVPRFMPSDFAADFRGSAPGTNRNFDLRREFMERLDAAPIRATSILNGMFADLLVGAAPMVIRKIRRVVHWGPADQRYDFTTMDDTAAYAARAAIDEAAPRWLRISGQSTDARGVARAATVAFGQRFRTFRAGSVATLGRLARLARRLNPAEHETFPAWQGMQYFHSMASGGVDFGPVDNGRYGPRRWTTVEEVLRRGEGEDEPAQPASR